MSFRPHRAVVRFGSHGRRAVRFSLGRSTTREEIEASVELVLREITDCLERGKTVKLSSFGSFMVRKKKQRMGRNPKTGIEAPISPRRVIVFKDTAMRRILRARENPHEHYSKNTSGDALFGVPRVCCLFCCFAFGCVCLRSQSMLTIDAAMQLTRV